MGKEGGWGGRGEGGKGSDGKGGGGGGGEGGMGKEGGMVHSLINTHRPHIHAHLQLSINPVSIQVNASSLSQVHVWQPLSHA